MIKKVPIWKILIALPFALAVVFVCVNFLFGVLFGEQIVGMSDSDEMQLIISTFIFTIPLLIHKK